MVKTRLPQVVIGDLTTYFDQIGIYRMDANKRLPTSKGKYMVEVEGIPIEFHNVELAPPSGVVAANYSRFVFLSNNKYLSNIFQSNTL
jgi:hypothetical protein